MKKLTQNLFKALVATIFIGGSFHLILLALVAIKNSDTSYINPIDFLGLGYAFPSLAGNRQVAIIAWVVLAFVYLLMVYLITHYHRYLGLVKEHLSNFDVKSKNDQ